MTVVQHTHTPAINILQEATQVVQHYHTANVSQWACDVCGSLHSGISPASCDTCGASDTFTKLQQRSTEIGSRW
jgi:rubrerythrin